MSKYHIKWTNDKFEDYESEEEWINAYPDDPCPNCGRPDVKAGDCCPSCSVKLDRKVFRAFDICK